MFTALPRRARPSRTLHGRRIVEQLEDRLVLQGDSVIPAGFDHWATPLPDGNSDSFMDVQLPAGFFEAGSEPFQGPIFFQGMPTGPLGRPPGPMFADQDTVVMRSPMGQLELNRLPGDFAPFGTGPGLGNTDTIVHRAEISLAGLGVPETVPIELVALSLVSCNPITVTYTDGSTSQWDVRVALSSTAPQPQGSMTVTKTHDNGGTFDSTLPVMPRLTFVKLTLTGPPLEREYEPQNPQTFTGGGTFQVIKEHDEYARSIGQVTLFMPDGSSDTIPLRGTSAVDANVTPRGDAVDTDGDGLEQVQAEIVSLNLSGSGVIGPVQIRLHPRQRAFGETEELVNATPDILDVGPFTSTGVAQSFFDVFFEVQLAGQIFYTDGSVHLEGTVTQKPAGPGEPFR